MRVFVALDLSPEILERLVGFQSEMKQIAPREKWVRPETFHITLKFIGETKCVEEIMDTLKEVQVPRFELMIRGADFFTPQKPRIFYACVHADATLTQLAQAVDLASSQCGIPREKDPYRPHVSLARNGTGKPSGGPNDRKVPLMRQLQQRLAQMPEPDFGTMTATEFFLYESRLTPKGAQYKKIARYELK